MATTKSAFTDRAIEARKLTRGAKRELWWDQGQPGLYVLISSASKTYRSRFQLNGKWMTRKLAAHGELAINEAGDAILVDVQWARGMAKRDRALACAGIDPRKQPKPAAAAARTYEAVVDAFIQHHAKPRQRTWQQTERVLKRSCAVWLDRPFADISKQDARDLLRGFIAAGHGPKAGITLAWLRTLWRWACDEEIVATNFMPSIKIEYEKGIRDRVWSNEDLKAIWHAADQLDPIEGGFVKLTVLLGPRTR